MKSKDRKMKDESLPCTDFDLFKEVVLSRHPSAALPKNLSDHWLEVILRDIQMLLDDSEPEQHDPAHMAAPVALVLHLLAGKHDGKSVEIDVETFLNYLRHLRAEIFLEQINRRSSVQASGPTLETIFENREVRVTTPSDF